MNDFKREITKAFKLSGFQIRSDLSQYLATQLADFNRDEQKSYIDRITDSIQSQELLVPNIEKEHLDIALNQCSNRNLCETETVFSVINAFDVPKYIFDNQKKKFVLHEKPKSLLPAASDKAEYIRNRYMMLWQRTSRHELFAPPVLNTTKPTQMFDLKRIENLLATTAMNNVVVLGYLTSFVEGKFHLEDPTGSVQLDITNVKFHAGLFCEGCFVLAEGKYRDGVLKCCGLGFPPPESEASSRAYYGVANYWGGKSKTLLKTSQSLKSVEQDNLDHMIIFISDCWLNDSVVLDKIKKLLLGYEDCPPVAIVMMGPFSKNLPDMYKLKKYFSALGDIISRCGNIARDTDIILVPSLDDPVAPSILPRPPLPNHLISELVRKAPRVIAASNPCRLQYCTQQIVIARIDLITKLCRNVLKFPETGELANHFARTLISQGTLAPLHPIALPIYWNHDAAMSLYPLPDLVVIGDPSHGFEITQQGCQVMNTGSFPKSKFCFKVYVPATRMVEESQITDDPE